MALTVTYGYPVAGVVAPTALQAANQVVADVIASADGDVAATVVHNFGLSVAELAAMQPEVQILALLQAEALLSGWAVTAFATNSITLAKSAAGGSGAATAQIRVTCRRPHSIAR